MIKFTRKCSCLAKNWRTGPWLLQQYTVWVWTCGKKNKIIQNCNVYHFLWYMGKMINHKLRGSLLSEKPLLFLGIFCFWASSSSRQDGRRREVMTRIPPPPKKELHLSLPPPLGRSFLTTMRGFLVRWFAALVLVFWSSVLNSLYHKTQ